MKRIRHVWTDAHGIETVQWIAWGGVLLILIAVVYGVFDGNAQLRAAIRNTTAFLAVRFGSDIGARGPRGTAPCLDAPFSQQCSGSVATPPTIRAIVFDPRTASYVTITPLGRILIRPVAGVPVVAEPHIGRIRLFDALRQRTILLDRVAWEAIAIDTDAGEPVARQAAMVTRILEAFWASNVPAVAARDDEDVLLHRGGLRSHDIPCPIAQV